VRQVSPTQTSEYFSDEKVVCQDEEVRQKAIDADSTRKGGELKIRKKVRVVDGGLSNMLNPSVIFIYPYPFLVKEKKEGKIWEEIQK
jgi:broad-specificity NMP kinase